MASPLSTRGRSGTAGNPYADSLQAAQTGPAGPDQDETVSFRPVLRRGERRLLTLLVVGDVCVHVVFLVWLAAPAHWLASTTGRSTASAVVATGCFVLLVLVELIRAAQGITGWIFSLAARDPVPMAPPTGLRVAALTTIVPSAEPIEMVARTLAAMRRLRYADGDVDVWILDEGDDAQVRTVAADLGVHHFSRRGVPELNTASGAFRARTKAGNHNAWFRAHGADYDVVAQLDPDHVPEPHFLDRTLGYFRDPDVAFVVAPQVYGDAGKSLPAHGAAAQAYLFHGVIQRGGNGLGAPLLIGTNHAYRTRTWHQIGGYQDCIIEDHLTSMVVHSELNPETRRRWKGVYTPEVLAVGQAPTTWGDLFIQQRRWAQGAIEIALRHSPRLLPRLRPAQRLVYLLLQSFYPSVALSWVLGCVVTAALLLGGPVFGPTESVWWLVLWASSVASSLGLFLWLRRLNLAEHERRESAVHGIVTTVCTAPVYTAAAVNALLRRPLTYRVTPKAATGRRESASSFSLHLRWLTVVTGTVLAGALLGDAAAVTWGWAVLVALACAVPPASYVVQWLRDHRSAAVSNTSTVAEP